MIQDWRRQAACVGMDQALFFPARGDPDAYKIARTVCASCPVRRPCLELAFVVDPGGQYGMFGGLAPEERHRIRRRGLAVPA